MTLVHETDINGVRCFWVETNRPTLRASLMFRQGLADEKLAESGWLHLLEHLALEGKGGGALSINGSVSLLHTSFDAHGPADLVASHLSAVSRWLQDPQLSRLEHERGVLAAESSSRGGSGVRALGWRYGARGPGVLNLDEPGLGRATEGALRERAHQVFTSGNAVLVLDGPPPEGLTLELHAGELLRPGTAVPCDDALPAVYREEAGVIFSGVVERSMGAVLLPYVLERVLRDRLRHEAGAAYAPWGDYQAVDDDHAVVLAGSDIAPKMLPEVFTEITSLVGSIRDDGLPPEIVAEAVDLRVQAINDPYNSVGLAYAAGMYALNREAPKSLEEIVAENRAVTAESLQADALAFTDTLLVGVPSEATVAGDWPQLAPPSHFPRPEGRLFRHRDWPAATDELRVADNSVQISNGGYARSMKFDALEAMFAYDDGGRYVIDRDGWGFAIEPFEWVDGELAVSMLDRVVTPARRCPRPAREFTPPPRLSALKRWSAGVRRFQFRRKVSLWWMLLALFIVSRIAIELSRTR